MKSTGANAPLGSEEDAFAEAGTGSGFSGEVAAGGTLRRKPGVSQPGLWRSIWLALEIVLLYLVVPIGLIHVVLSYRLPLFTVLPPMLATFVTILLLDRGFSLRRELGRGVRLRTLLSILASFAIAGSAIAYAVSELMPRHFLNMMMERREVWERVMLLYPFLSVVPQEIAYRTFFFHRYGPLFRDNSVALIVINGLLFGFGHVLFANWLAVAGTFVTGMLFAWRYHANRSFWAVWIEHTLWGWLVFTVGLGGFFFTGVSNLR
ncbi:MAG: CPBP family intramembrane metalloprotease [Hyphomicrobiaceae bacterium]|nr:CPBP family intramembrane metalloprotease [Hyphomicrobiaceae bacterium]